jgi:hypothetical protein
VEVDVPLATEIELAPMPFPSRNPSRGRLIDAAAGGLVLVVSITAFAVSRGGPAERPHRRPPPLLPRAHPVVAVVVHFALFIHDRWCSVVLQEMRGRTPEFPTLEKFSPTVSGT